MDLSLVKSGTLGPFPFRDVSLLVSRTRFAAIVSNIARALSQFFETFGDPSSDNVLEDLPKRLSRSCSKEAKRLCSWVDRSERDIVLKYVIILLSKAE